MSSVDQYADSTIAWLHETDTAPAGLRILHAAHEPVTEAIPTWLLDAPQTAELAVIEPVTVHRWDISWWMFVLGVGAGMITMALMLEFI